MLDSLSLNSSLYHCPSRNLTSSALFEAAVRNLLFDLIFKASSRMLQTFLRHASNKFAVATADALQHMWMFVQTCRRHCRFSQPLSPIDRESWVELNSEVACTLNTSIPFKHKARRKVYLFNKGNSFSQLSSEDTDIEEDWELFKSALMTSVDWNIPSKMVVASSHGYRHDMRHLIRQRIELIHAKYKKTGNNRLNTPYGAN